MSQQRNEPEVLAQRLDQVLPPGKKSVLSTLPDPLISTAALLARTDVPSLEPRASRRIESRMLEAFDAQHAPRLSIRSRRPTRLLRWALVASLALVMLVVGLTPAVGASLPGEPLYSVKQFYEEIELAAATTPPTRASVYLHHADRRTREALTLLERKQFAPELVSAALANIDAATRLETEVRASPRLRWQLLQVETTLTFIIQDATQSGIVSQQEVAPLSNQIEQYANSDLLLPPATPEPTPVPAVTVLTNTAVPSATATETPTSTKTPVPVPTATKEEALAEVTENTSLPPTPSGLVATPTCQSPGNACNSQGVPGGQVIPPTHGPTNTPRNSPAPPGNNGNNGNSNGGGNGNGNGSDNSSANNGNGGSGNGNGGNNGSGNNGNGGGGGNGNSGGNGKP